MEIYTDGATSNNGYEGARGGWAWILVDDGVIIDQGSGHIDNATNNICELTALIYACNSYYAAGHKKPVTVYSDSAYCIDCCNQKWYVKWASNGWINSKRQLVANRQLWEQLIPYFNNPNFSFKKVTGHSNDMFNNIVDAMAVGEK